MEQTTLKQSVNFLGFLRSQLSGLQGIPTLCYELIQNADDVKDGQGNPAAFRITFDVRDDALYVENDGVFREIDFERMLNVSWGNKKEEAGTTGAFGIGFISVYQITDSPEIFSSGRHWVFHPGEVEDKRIIETRLATEFTKFRLPWAFDPSKMRQDLGIAPVEKQMLDDYALQIAQSIGEAALFLKQVNYLEIKRNGTTIRKIKTVKNKDILLVSDDDKDTRWRMIEGRFDVQADDMRQKYSNLIETKRQANIRLAIPEVPLENGLLYAFLPSETHTGLPFHINADFYPSSDRKRILFDTDYKSEWNRLAIICAARTLGDRLDDVLEIFSLQSFWKFAQSVKNASANVNVDQVFGAFWEQLKPQVRIKQTVLTGRSSKAVPSSTYYLDTDEEIAAVEIFETLGLQTVNRDLRPYRNLLIEVGTNQLKPLDIGVKYLGAGFNDQTAVENFPAGLRNLDEWNVFWSALNSLWGRTSILDQKTSEVILKQCAIALGSDQFFYPPDRLFSTDDATQKLFSKISDAAWLTSQNPVPLPGSLVSEFSLLDGLQTLELNLHRLREFYKTDKAIIREIYEWLSKHEASISRYPDIKARIRQLEIWPVAEGDLKPLTKLYLAGDFNDPLNLADLIDIEALGGRREFLERVLNVNQMNFTNYVKDWLPNEIKSHKLPSEKILKLIGVLAENLGKLQGESHLKALLADLPIVWCGDQLFSRAVDAYFPSPDIQTVLGPDISMAKLPDQHADAIRALYEWLGVAFEPRSSAIVTRIRLLTSTHPDAENVEKIQRILAFFSFKWMYWDESKRQEFSTLKRIAWLPGSKKKDAWCAPHEVYSIFQNFLFESQGNFLLLDKPAQQRANDFIKFLGIPTEPEVELVVKHLLDLSKSGGTANSEIYAFLSRNAFEPCISQLAEKPCLFLKFESGDERYFRPDQVFWEQHPFGEFRFRLGPEFGKFKSLYDRLHVKSKPDAYDAIKVLSEISGSKQALSNIQLEQTSELAQIIIATWKLLGESLDKSEIKPTLLRKELGARKTILNPGTKLLDKPERLFFEDRPGWGEKFDLVKNNLIPRVEGAWLAMEAAGVRRISNAISTEIHECVNSRIDEQIANKLINRRNLVQRVIDAHQAKGIKGFDLGALDNLKFESAEKIEIVRTFHAFGVERAGSSVKLEADAIRIDSVLYYRKIENEYPWLDIAREMTYVLYPNGDINSLGMELKEILSSPSFEIANKNFDQLGYPRIESVDIEIKTEGLDTRPGGEQSQEYIQHAEISDTQTGGSAPELTDDSEHETKISTNSETEPLTPSVSKPKLPERKSSRLVSYVYPEDELRDEKPESDENTNRKIEIGQLGVAKVMAHEISENRTPQEMPPNNPGYDIKSVDSMGRVRFIEVKALTNQWDGQSPAQMTRTEFDLSKELGSSYWLYIVELVESENYQIYQIQNPANQVDYYLFDHGWRPLADKKTG